MFLAGPLNLNNLLSPVVLCLRNKVKKKGGGENTWSMTLQFLKRRLSCVKFLGKSVLWERGLQWKGKQGKVDGLKGKK